MLHGELVCRKTWMWWSTTLLTWNISRTFTEKDLNKVLLQTQSLSDTGFLWRTSWARSLFWYHALRAESPRFHLWSNYHSVHSWHLWFWFVQDKFFHWWRGYGSLYCFVFQSKAIQWTLSEYSGSIIFRRKPHRFKLMFVYLQQQTLVFCYASQSIAIEGYKMTASRA